MSKIYSGEMIHKLFNDEKFLLEYNEYSKDNYNLNNLKKFINSIELNKKYFRLEMNKKHGYKKNIKIKILEKILFQSKK